jgi:hypothetical protein
MTGSTLGLRVAPLQWKNTGVVKPTHAVHPIVTTQAIRTKLLQVSIHKLRVRRRMAIYADFGIKNVHITQMTGVAAQRLP